MPTAGFYFCSMLAFPFNTAFACVLDREGDNCDIKGSDQLLYLVGSEANNNEHSVSIQQIWEPFIFLVFMFFYYSYPYKNLWIYEYEMEADELQISSRWTACFL